VTSDLPQTFDVKGVGQGHRVTTSQRQKRYKLGTDTLIEFKLSENYHRAERETRHMFKVIRLNTEIAITPPKIARFRSNIERV